MLSSAKKLILCANNHSLTAGIWHGTKLQSYAVFNNIDQDYTAFSQYLTKQPNTNIYLIVDAVEEDYKLESLPHTAGRARREIIERKLNQFNRNSTFRTAHFINRAPDKRKDDNFLFVALSNADSLQGWLDVIQANQSPLVGVYLLPMISQVMVRQMKLMAPHILLCEQLPSGFRQTYLHNGRIRMSRLVPMVGIKPNQLAYFYLVEIEKTRLYLMSQRLINGETPLQMVLPALDNSHHEIAKSISQDQGLECKTVDILAYAKNINLAESLIKPHPELLHMQLLANGPLKAKLPQGRAIWLDGGHNPDAGVAIAKLLGDGPPVHIILGMLKNKDVVGFLKPFADKIASLYAVPIPGHEHHDPEDLCLLVQDAMGVLKASPVFTVSEALDRIAAAGTEGDVLICGSLYLAGEVLRGNEQIPD